MQEGEALIQITVAGGGYTIPGFGMTSIAGMGQQGSNQAEERIQWREKTGRKSGRIFKSDEEKTLKIVGQRCKICGYIEFYAKE